MKTFAFRAFLVTLVLFLAGYVFANEIQVDVPADNRLHESEEEYAVVEPSTLGVDTSTIIDLMSDNYSFNPDVIEVRPGDRITVRLENIIGEHDFVIDELDVHTEHVHMTGDVEEVTFVVPEDVEKRRYEFYCGVGNHRALGMIGELRIID